MTVFTQIWIYLLCRELRTGIKLMQTLDSEANIQRISIM